MLLFFFFLVQIHNLYSLNKTSEIENGLNAILGFDFKIDEKQKNKPNREKKIADKLGLNRGVVLKICQSQQI